MATSKNCPLCSGEGMPPTSLTNQERFLRCQRCRVLFDKEPHVIDYKNQFYDNNPFFNLKLYLEKGASLHLFAHFLVLMDYALRLLNRADALDARRLKLLWTRFVVGYGTLLRMGRSGR